MKLDKKGTPEDRCRCAFRNGMTAKQLAHAAQVSESTAKRWRARFVDQETLVGVASKATQQMPAEKRRA